jgi:hypothetical protein
MRSLIRDQAENTRVALEYVQVGANKAALDAMCKEKDEEFQKALADLDEGKAVSPSWAVAHLITLRQRKRPTWTPRLFPKTLLRPAEPP